MDVEVVALMLVLVFSIEDEGGGLENVGSNLFLFTVVEVCRCGCRERHVPVDYRCCVVGRKGTNLWGVAFEDILAVMFGDRGVVAPTLILVFEGAGRKGWCRGVAWVRSLEDRRTVFVRAGWMLETTSKWIVYQVGMQGGPGPKEVSETEMLRKPLSKRREKPINSSS